MKDVNGKEFVQNDWLRGMGYVPYGKVTSVEEHELTYKEAAEEGFGEEKTLTEKDVQDMAVVVFEYSDIRRRSVNGEIPSDFYTLTASLECTRLPEYARISYFEALIGDIVDMTGKFEEPVGLTTLLGYEEAVKEAILNNEDEDSFIDEMVKWFTVHA